MLLLVLDLFIRLASFYVELLKQYLLLTSSGLEIDNYLNFIRGKII